MQILVERNARIPKSRSNALLLAIRESAMQIAINSRPIVRATVQILKVDQVAAFAHF
jgi:hypothetical protein